MADHRIFKYLIDLNKPRQHVAMPQDARILSVQIQHGECQLWALLDNSQPDVSRVFEVLPTGAFVDRAERLAFIGTVQTYGGSLVFHVFERRMG